MKWCPLVAGDGLYTGESWLKPSFFLPDSNGHPHCAERPWTGVTCKSESSGQLTAPPCPLSPRTEFSSPRGGKKAGGWGHLGLGPLCSGDIQVKLPLG